MMLKRGQVTIFIIIAILLVAMVTLFFLFKNKIAPNKIPSNIEPVYNTFISCLEEDMSLGIDALESQGGYIYIPAYEQGSEYMPFSSQLDFLGNPIPYWYYVSGNNIQREQVPSKSKMEMDIEKFLELRVRDCDFDTYYYQGFEILMDEPEAEVIIKDDKVLLDLTMKMSISKDEDRHIVEKHELTYETELGSLYDSAVKVYEREQESLFLEDYAIDVLRLYAPVDGVEITCSPKIWDADEVFDELSGAIEANTIALRNSNNKKEYFDVEISEIPPNHRVRFLNSKEWSSTYEVNPSEGSVMKANPVGNQEGMGILGFCYVPYHFVYSLKYPVLVQIISGNNADEIFQFPLAVIIERNQPRNVSGGEAIQVDYAELCNDMNTNMTVRVFDTNTKPIDAYVSYSCLGTTCNIGSTRSGRIIKEFPQCANGFINVRAEGYKEEEIMFSTIQEGEVSIYLTKLNNLSILLKVNNQVYTKDAIISFTSEDISKTLAYPQQKNIELSEGDYEIEVQIYKNSSLKLGSSTQEQCIDVPRSSVLGAIGLTKRECYPVQIPEQMITSALSAGGKSRYSFSESQLKNSKVIEISASSLPNPNSLEQIQENYFLIEGQTLEVKLK